MQAIRSIFFLILWICFSTVTKAQDGCSGLSIPTSGYIALPSTIKDTYANGESLRLSCQTGYSGQLKQTCQNGQWTITGNQRCEPKQCGHPGDVLNGDFTLTMGKDFVFGSQVQYTCRQGYELVGNINHRSCMDQGWDNALPVCEVVKCDPIEPTGDLIASGNTELPQYGDVIEFKCKTDGSQLDHAEHIYCMHTGKWSKSLPNCKEIHCEPAEIPHGRTTSQDKVYKQNEILSFACNTNYIPVGRPSSTCTKDGWYPKPQCKEMSCRMGESENIVKNSYRQNTYRVGQTPPNYSCLSGFRPSEGSKCQHEGWVPPLCQAKTCDPKIPNARILGEDRLYGLDERLEYQCNPFHTPQEKQVAHCTVNGWNLKSHCKATIPFCTRPVLGNGFLIPDNENYEDASVIRYGCNPGYKRLQEPWWGKITCKNKNWSNIPNCIDEKNCAPPTSDAKVKSSKKMYSDNESVTFECVRGYHFEGKNENKCVNGSWETPLPVCEPTAKRCKLPRRVEHAVIISDYKKEYEHNSKLEYQCKELYTINDKESQCNNGNWTSIPKCTEINYCVIPSLSYGTVLTATRIVLEGKTLDYECLYPYQKKHEGTVTCKDAQWDVPVGCTGTKAPCGAPPEVTNGDVERKEVQNGVVFEVTYRCKRYYTLKDKTPVRCHNGNWTPYPVCLDPCEIETIDAMYHLENPDYPNIRYVKEGDSTILNCESNYYAHRSYRGTLVNRMEVKCKNGIIDYTPCKPRDHFWKK